MKIADNRGASCSLISSMSHRGSASDAQVGFLGCSIMRRDARQAAARRLPNSLNRLAQRPRYALFGARTGTNSRIFEETESRAVFHHKWSTRGMATEGF